MEEIPGSGKFFPAQLVFLALGFLGPQQELLKALEVKTDARMNIATAPKVDWLPSGHLRAATQTVYLQKYATNQPGVFAAGDCRRGQSLIVWGIKCVIYCNIGRHRYTTLLLSSEGRGAAVEVDAYLSQGNTRLPTAGGIVTRVWNPFQSECICKLAC